MTCRADFLRKRDGGGPAAAAHIDDPLSNQSLELNLPAGWHYSTQTLTQDLQMNSNGLATIINDDLANSYQQLNP